MCFRRGCSISRCTNAEGGSGYLPTGRASIWGRTAWSAESMDPGPPDAGSNDSTVSCCFRIIQVLLGKYTRFGNGVSFPNWAKMTWDLTLKLRPGHRRRRRHPTQVQHLKMITCTESFVRDRPGCILRTKGLQVNKINDCNGATWRRQWRSSVVPDEMRTAAAAATASGKERTFAAFPCLMECEIQYLFLLAEIILHSMNNATCSDNWANDETSTLGTIAYLTTNVFQHLSKWS